MPPPSGVMMPKPFASLTHLIVPVAFVVIISGGVFGKLVVRQMAGVHVIEREAAPGWSDVAADAGKQANEDRWVSCTRQRSGRSSDFEPQVRRRALRKISE